MICLNIIYSPGIFGAMSFVLIDSAVSLWCVGSLRQHCDFWGRVCYEVLNLCEFLLLQAGLSAATAMLRLWEQDTAYYQRVKGCPVTSACPNNIPALPGMLPGFPLGVWGQALVLLKDTVLKGNSEMTTDSFVGLWSLVQLKKSFHCNHFWPVWWLSFPPPAPILSFPLNVL